MAKLFFFFVFTLQILYLKFIQFHKICWILSHKNNFCLVPITWRNAPENQFTVAGKDYLVQCDVTSNPAPAVDWLRNGDQVC